MRQHLLGGARVREHPMPRMQRRLEEDRRLAERRGVVEQHQKRASVAEHLFAEASRVDVPEEDRPDEAVADGVDAAHPHAHQRHLRPENTDYGRL